jgi:hypothetical protein
MIVETGSNKSVNINSMGNLVEQNLLAMKQFRAPFVLGLWTVCLLLIFGSFATALIAITTFITLFVYFGDMLSNTSTELVKTTSAACNTISLIKSDFYSFISKYKNHFLTHRDPTSIVHKLSGDVTIPPFTCHKIRVKTNLDETFTNYETDILKPNDCLDKSTLVLFEGGRDSITLSNFSPLPLKFPDNFPLGELEKDNIFEVFNREPDLVIPYKEPP